MPGAKAHIARLKKLSGPQMINAVGKALFHGGEIIQVEAQISITAGAVSGKNHVASSPGQPPNNDTGLLAGNIRTTQKAPLLVEVSSSAPYAAPLEFGTSRMAARPYMTPARDKKRGEVTKIVRDAVERVVKRSGGGR
ncbi:HK97-gp10 family putative phage morphogenesis protein [Sphingosinicella xenopeptidilytica]|uniref:HK97-gp10 family putative phage morphogenesis protein n=1 Tax=Sphingosinicella xenopeptidilytica TaxID=364098 RepID=A0ABW3C3A5_SPHXN